MTRRLLHVLSQRPGRTGSGVTLDALVRRASAAGWEQAALVGVPADETMPQVGDLAPEAVHRVTFAPTVPGAGSHPDLPFPVPGVSDVMPYPSSVWSRLGPGDLDLYRAAWRRRLAETVALVRPDVIQANHLWLVSALLKDAAPRIPVVATCHATGLRQMDLCPALADEVVRGCRRIERFAVLRPDHRDALARRLGVDPGRVTVVGAGFDEAVFAGPAAADDVRRGRLLYVGKTSRAKGVPWLLEAFTRLADADPDLVLHCVGGGAGEEADLLHALMDAHPGRIVRHGPLPPPQVAALMRRCAVAVLPSLYEGVPLVLAEAAACGCRLVATALPGITSTLAPLLGERLSLVEPPDLQGVDEPVQEALPAFVDRLTGALGIALAAPALPAPPSASLAELTWHNVFKRMEYLWFKSIFTGM